MTKKACLLPYDLKDKPEVMACVKALKCDSLDLIRKIYTLIMENGRNYCSLRDVMALAQYNRYRIVRIKRILYDFDLFQVRNDKVSRKACLKWRPHEKTNEEKRKDLESRDNSQTLFPRELDEMDEEAKQQLTERLDNYGTCAE